MLSRYCIGLTLGMVLACIPFRVLHAEDEAPSTVGAVLKLFKSGRVPAERQGTVVEMICNRGNEHDLRVVFDQLIQPNVFSPELRVKALGWLTEAATTRKVKPTGDLNPIGKLMDDPNSGLQLAAIRLASVWQLNSVAKSLQFIATNDKINPELQKAAINGLVAIGGAESKSTLTELANRNHPIPVRIQAVTGLVGLDVDAASKQAALILVDASATDKIQEMLTAFLDRRDGADKLALTIQDQKLTVDVAKTALRFMYSIGRSDASLSDVLSRAAGVATDPTPPTQEEVAKLVEQVIAHGDAARGEKIFRRGELSCLKCHSVNRAGGQVGPDLSAVGVSSPVDYVINSILNPNLAVKEQYVIRVFLLDDGQVLNGVVIDRDDDRVRIRDSQGKTITIATADVENEKEGKSQMPQGLSKFLTNQDVVDLAKFISELGKPGPYGIRKIPSIQRWHVMNNPAQELVAEVPHLENIRELVLNSKPEQWASAFGKISGALPLEELRVDGKPTVLILQGDVQINEPGKLAFQIATTEKYQVWLDDQPMDSRSRFEANLQSGRHTVTIRVEVSDRDAPELRVEVSRSSDSSAQFEVVGGS